MKHLLVLIGIITILSLSTYQAESISPDKEVNIEVTHTVGKGTIEEVAWEPAGTRFVVGGSAGLWLYQITEENRIFNERQLNYGVGTENVAWSYNGQWLAEVREPTPDVIMIWNMATQTSPVSLDNNNETLQLLKWNPVVSQLATAGKYQDIHLWTWDESDSSWQLSLLVGHNDEVTALAWSRDGQFLASASLDKTVRVWQKDDETGEWVSTILPSSLDIPTTLAWNQYDQLAIGGKYEKTHQTLEVWQWDSVFNEGHKLVETRQATNTVSVGWNENGEWLAAATSLGEIIIWDLVQNELVVKMENRTPINGLYWNINDSFLVTTGGDVLTWEPTTAQISTIFEGDRSAYTKAFPRPGHSQFLGVYKNSLYLWELGATPQLLDFYYEHNGPVFDIEWKPNSNILGGIELDGWVRAWDTSTSELVGALPIQTSADGIAIAWNSDWSMLAAVDETLGVIVYDWQDAIATPPFGPIDIVANYEDFSGWIIDIDWSNDEDKIVGIEYFSQSPLVFYTSMGGWQFAGSLEDSDRIYSHSADTRPNPNLDQIAISSPDDNYEVHLDLWDLSTSNLIDNVLLPTSERVQLDWQPDGNRLAAISYDGNIFVWSPPNTDLLMLSTSSNNQLTSVSWGDNGLLAVGGENGVTIFDFSITPVMEVGHFKEFGKVVGVKWDDDGQRLAISSEAGIIYIVTANTLPSPSNLQAIANSDSSTDLEWNYGISSHEGFVIERSINSSEWELIATLGPEARSYSDEPLNCGTGYFYRVQAYQGTVFSPSSNIASYNNWCMPNSTRGDNCNQYSHL